MEINKLVAEHSFTVMPKDCNFNLNRDTNTNNVLFGGKLLYDLDYAGAKVVRRATYEVECDYVVTACCDKVNFDKPAYIGDIVKYVAEIKGFGKTSIQVRVKVFRESIKGEIEPISSSNMVFVTIKDGKPFEHKLNFDKLSK